MPKTPAKRTRITANRAAGPLPEHAPPQPPAVHAPAGSHLTTEQPAARLLYCTIATASELPQALRLRAELLAAQLDFRLLLLEQPAVVARLRGELPELAGSLLGPDELACTQWLEMAFYYDRREYAAALLPALLRTLLRQGDVVYLDPNSEPSGVPAPWADADGSAGLLALAARADGGAVPAAGSFAPGFLAVRQSAAVVALLLQLEEQLAAAGCQHPELAPHPGLAWASALATAAARAGIRTAPSDRRRVRVASLPAPDPRQRFATIPYSFARYTTGEPIPESHRRALWLLPAVNRRALVDPFVERPYISRLAAQLAADPGPDGLRAPAQSRTSSLRAAAAKIVDTLAEAAVPGGRERITEALHAAAARQASLRHYAAWALDRVVPGSRGRLHYVVQSATTSPSPAIRRTAELLLRAAGERP